MLFPTFILPLVLAGGDDVMTSGIPRENGLYPGAPPIQFSSLTGPTFVHGNASTVRVVEGTTAVLPCAIKNLRKHSVSWVRGRDIRLLTNSFLTYTSDSRFVPVNPDQGEQWLLKIHYVRKTDDGDYLCQVSTTPPVTRVVTLKVQEAVARVFPNTEVYVQAGSRLEIICQVEGCPIPALLSWTRFGMWLSAPPSESFHKEDGDSSVPITQLKLLRHKARAVDSGTYTCVSTCTQPINATVHVLRGEELAAMQHHNSCPRAAPAKPCMAVLAAWIITILPWNCLMEDGHCTLSGRPRRPPLNCSSRECQSAT